MTMKKSCLQFQTLIVNIQKVKVKNTYKPVFYLQIRYQNHILLILPKNKLLAIKIIFYVYFEYNGVMK